MVLKNTFFENGFKLLVIKIGKQKMSVNSILNLYKFHNTNSVRTMLWVMSKIDNNKLFERVKYAYEHPTEKTKCVLLEYSYTSRTYQQMGHPNIVEYLPGTTVLVHHALNSPDFIRLIDDVFCENRAGINVYVRQRIGSDGKPDFHRKQLVLSFDPWTFAPSLESTDIQAPIMLNCLTL